jgi:hypothetical protein
VNTLHILQKYALFVFYKNIIQSLPQPVFVADKLSDLNKKQLDALKVNWVELRSEDGYKKFGKVLQNLNIPHTPFSGDLSKRLAEIFALIF